MLSSRFTSPSLILSMLFELHDFISIPLIITQINASINCPWNINFINKIKANIKTLFHILCLFMKKTILRMNFYLSFKAWINVIHNLLHMIMVNFLIIFIFINKAGNFFFFFFKKKTNVEVHVGVRGVCVCVYIYIHK